MAAVIVPADCLVNHVTQRHRYNKTGIRTPVQPEGPVDAVPEVVSEHDRDHGRTRHVAGFQGEPAGGRTGEGRMKHSGRDYPTPYGLEFKLLRQFAFWAKMQQLTTKFFICLYNDIMGISSLLGQSISAFPFFDSCCLSNHSISV